MMAGGLQVCLLRPLSRALSQWLDASGRLLRDSVFLSERPRFRVPYQQGWHSAPASRELRLSWSNMRRFRGTVTGVEVNVSLRRALAALPDDRDTAAAARKVIMFFHGHAHDPVGAERVARATGLSPDRTLPVMSALALEGVLNCDGDPSLSQCRYEPDRILALEVDRFMRTSNSSSVRVQSGIDRYRDRFGHS